MSLTRPYPPLELIDAGQTRFLPAPEAEAWARKAFIDDDALMVNEDHAHLQSAELGFLWTNEPNERKMKTVIGTCELGTPASGGKWGRARQILQFREWFGFEPDFVITMFAPWCAAADDASFCALAEHELYHAGQALDSAGQPKFNEETGGPVFAMRGHDVEEFVGVVRRYGADAAGVRDMVEAANRPPEIGAARIQRACGTCLRVVG